MKDVVEIEQKALILQNEGYIRKAADLFKQIVDEDPNFEFGACFYNLAGCLEDLGELEEAEKNYIKAIEYDNEDTHRLGGYASFLYLHGDPSDAFEKHIELIKLEKKIGFDFSITVMALKTLGERIGLTEDEVIVKVNSL